jgi:DNA-binding NtrC family response regulator
MPGPASSVESQRSHASVRRTTAPPRILVVDDEPDACEAFRLVLEQEGYRTTAETSPRSALEKLATEMFDLVLTDVSMAEMNGLDLCREIVGTRPGMPVILVTGKGSMDTVIAALRMGACDFLKKPLDARALVGSVAKNLRPVAARAAAVTTEPSDSPAADLVLTGMPGRCSAMRQVYHVIQSLSDSLVSVVVDGETGTGKESVARALHENSRLKGGPFIALSCAAMPAGLLESELFGHVRGAFTDARTAKKGLFVEANGGTLLLDEIGELPLALQPKLLRALQERRVRPIGGYEEVPFDCRIVASTNRDLEVEVHEKRFREDLFYRLNVVRITVPPLRERGDDVVLLARYFLERFAKRSARAMTLAESAEKKLVSYAWPGNVRELENCIERAVSLARLDELTVDDLPEKLRTPEAEHELPPREGDDPDVLPLAELERRHIIRAMSLVDGNKARAAELLGIDRSTLYRRLRWYGIRASN